MKDAARLLVYLLVVLVIGVLLAPILFWSAQWFIARGIFPALAKVDFESFFHRALLIAAVALLWPLLRAVRVRGLRDLDLDPNPRWTRDLLFGWLLAAIPLLCCGVAVVGLHIYSLRTSVSVSGLFQVLGATLVVPAIEETLFRGLILGILLRSCRPSMSTFATSAFFSIIHFLKAPERTSTIVTWTSGFNSIAHSFEQFRDPMLLGAAFTTLFLIAWILADTRLRTRSLWFPIGLHAGWIFAAGVFNKIAHREMIALPWLGKNLLVGIVPLLLALLTWLLVRLWLNHGRARKI